MPPSSEGSCIVITAKNGYQRSNKSWVLGRIVRDYEYWMNPAVRTRLKEMLNERHAYMKARTKPGTLVPRPSQTGLCISVYEPNLEKKAGEPSRDLIYWSGLLVASVQLTIAAILICTFGDWRILLITVVGTTLALLTGALSQWKEEKC
jgi:hypothetical protein